MLLSVYELDLRSSLFPQIYAEGLIHLDSARTLQGSSLSFNCGGTDDIVSTTGREVVTMMR